MSSSPIGNESGSTRIDLSNLEEGSNFHDRVQEEPRFLQTVLEHLSSDQSRISEHQELTCQAVRLIPARDIESDFCSRFFSAIKGTDVLNQIDDIGDTPLHQAIQHDDPAERLNLVKKLLKSGANPLQPAGLPTFMEPSSRLGSSALEMAINFDDKDVCETMIDHLSEEDVKKPIMGKILAQLFNRGQFDNIEKLIGKGVDINTKVKERNRVFSLLTMAVMKGEKVFVGRLLDAGADINIVAGRNMTPLSIACGSDDPEMALMLIEKGAKVDPKSFGDSPIHTACKSGQVKIVRKLLEKGVHIDTPNDEGLRPMSLAIMNGYEDLSLDLLERGADPKSCDADQSPLLSTACDYDLLEVAKKLLEKGADIDQANSKGKTCLHHACINQNFPFLELLLDHKAKLDLPDSDGATALHHALCLKNPALAQNLIAAGADVSLEHPQKNDYLHLACLNGHDDIVKMLLLKKCDINSPGEDGNTPLHIACKRNGATLALSFLERGAKFDVANNSGETPLHYACCFNQKPTFHKLMELGAPLDARDKSDRTPLLYACGLDDEEIALSLILSGAEVNIPSKSGQTALHFSTVNGLDNVTKELIAKGSKVDCSESNGWTPLHLVMEKGNRELALLFLKHGADPLRENHFHFTPFEASFDDSDETGAFHFFNGSLNMQQRVEEHDSNILEFLSEHPTELLNEAMVRDKTFNPLLVPILGAHPALYRSIKSASSEEDFQLYLSDLKANFPEKLSEFCRNADHSINLDQMKAELEKEVSIPPAPPLIELGELVELFDKINFTDPEAPLYRNPEELTDDGYPTTPEDLRRSLELFIRRIREKEPFIGTPPEGKPVQLEQFYENLKKPVLHIISEASDMDSDDKITAILDLAEAGGHCGTRYSGQAHSTYHNLKGSIKIESFPEKMQKKLLNMKTGIVERLARRMDASRRVRISDNPEPIHAYNDYIKLLGKTLELPVPSEINFDDPFGQKFSEEDEKAWTATFLSRFGPHQIIQNFKEELLPADGQPPQDLVSWFQDFVKEDFQKERFDAIKEKAHDFLSKNEDSPKAWQMLTTLLIKEDEIQLPRWSGSSEKLDSHLEKARAAEFMGNFVYDENYNITDEAFLYFLKKINILK